MNYSVAIQLCGCLFICLRVLRRGLFILNVLIRTLVVAVQRAEIRVAVIGDIAVSAAVGCVA